MLHRHCASCCRFSSPAPPQPGLPPMQSPGEPAALLPPAQRRLQRPVPGAQRCGQRSRARCRTETRQRAASAGPPSGPCRAAGAEWESMRLLVRQGRDRGTSGAAQGSSDSTQGMQPRELTHYTVCRPAHTSVSCPAPHLHRGCLHLSGRRHTHRLVGLQRIWRDAVLACTAGIRQQLGQSWACIKALTRLVWHKCICCTCATQRLSISCVRSHRLTNGPAQLARVLKRQAAAHAQHGCGQVRGIPNQRHPAASILLKREQVGAVWAWVLCALHTHSATMMLLQLASACSELPARAELCTCTGIDGDHPAQPTWHCSGSRQNWPCSTMAEGSVPAIRPAARCGKCGVHRWVAAGWGVQESTHLHSISGCRWFCC